MIKKVRKLNPQIWPVSGVQVVGKIEELPEALGGRPTQVEVVVENYLQVVPWDSTCDRALDLFMKTDFADPLPKENLILKLLEKVYFCDKEDLFWQKFFQNEAEWRISSWQYLLKLSPQFVIVLLNKLFRPEGPENLANRQLENLAHKLVADLCRIDHQLLFETALSCLSYSTGWSPGNAECLRRVAEGLAQSPKMLRIGLQAFSGWIGFLSLNLPKETSKNMIFALENSFFGSKNAEEVGKMLLEASQTERRVSADEARCFCALFQMLVQKALALSTQNPQINEALLSRVVKAVVKVKGTLAREKMDTQDFLAQVDLGKVLNMGLHLEICLRHPSQWIFCTFVEELTHFVRDKETFCRDFATLHLMRQISTQDFPNQGLVEYKIEEIFGSDLVGKVRVDQHPKIKKSQNQEGGPRFVGVTRDDLVGTFLDGFMNAQGSHLEPEDPLRNFRRSFLVNSSGRG